MPTNAFWVVVAEMRDFPESPSDWSPPRATEIGDERGRCACGAAQKAATRTTSTSTCVYGLGFSTVQPFIHKSMHGGNIWLPAFLKGGGGAYVIKVIQKDYTRTNESNNLVHKIHEIHLLVDPTPSPLAKGIFESNLWSTMPCSYKAPQKSVTYHNNPCAL